MEHGADRRGVGRRVGRARLGAGQGRRAERGAGGRLRRRAGVAAPGHGRRAPGGAAGAAHQRHGGGRPDQAVPERRGHRSRPGDRAGLDRGGLHALHRRPLPRALLDLRARRGQRPRAPRVRPGHPPREHHRAVGLGRPLRVRARRHRGPRAGRAQLRPLHRGAPGQAAGVAPSRQHRRRRQRRRLRGRNVRQPGPALRDPPPPPARQERLSSLPGPPSAWARPATTTP